MTDALTDRKADVRGRIEELRRARAADVLAGKRFADAEILAEAEAEFDALTDAEAEAGRRARQAAEEAEAKRRGELRRQIAAKAKAYFSAVQVADRAAGDLTAALSEARALAGEIGKLFAGMGERAPMALNVGSFDRRFSERLSSRLRTIGGRPSFFGDIEYANTWRQPAEDWTASEHKELAAMVSLVKSGNGKA